MATCSCTAGCYCFGLLSQEAPVVIVMAMNDCYDGYDWSVRSVVTGMMAEKHRLFLFSF